MPAPPLPESHIAAFWSHRIWYWYHLFKGLQLLTYHIWVVVSICFYFHPYLGKIPMLTNIFQMGWNHQLDIVVWHLFDENSFLSSSNLLKKATISCGSQNGLNLMPFEFVTAQHGTPTSKADPAVDSWKFEGWCWCRVTGKNLNNYSD